MVRTSPLIATVGVKLTIPLALVVQVVWAGVSGPVLYWVGAGIVCVGFVVVIWGGQSE